MNTDRPGTPAEHLVGPLWPAPGGTAWAGIWTLAGGSVAVATHCLVSTAGESTAASWVTMLAGTLLALLAVLLWLRPRRRHGLGATILVLAVVVLTARDDSVVLAALLAGIGGCLAILRAGGPPSTPPPRRGRRSSSFEATVLRRGDLAPVPVTVDDAVRR